MYMLYLLFMLTQAGPVASAPYIECSLEVILGMNQQLPGDQLTQRGKVIHGAALEVVSSTVGQTSA